MTRAIDVLRKEHDAILRMLEVTERATELLEGDNRLPAHTLNGLLQFFRLFADRCHHGKEEDLLFPMLEKKGLPKGGGPVAVMLWEHDQGRMLIQEMALAAEAYGRGEVAAGRLWASAARGYVRLLREHILKENNILFVMAEQLLSEAEQTELADAFERVETDRMGERTHERLHANMDKLAAEILQTIP